jgi:hypothetical protein
MAHDWIEEIAARAPAQIDAQLAIGETRAKELARIEEADYERRRADAKVDVARHAKLADEEVLPLQRERLDAHREWGRALGEPETGRPAGNVSGTHVSDAERKQRERARKIAAIPEDRFEEFKACDDPDRLTLAGALRLLPRTKSTKPTKSLMHQFRSACYVHVGLRRDRGDSDEKIRAELVANIDWALRQPPQTGQGEEL